MKNITKLIFVVVFTVILTSCATSTTKFGTNFTESQITQIIKGKTTSSDLTRIMGTPYMKTLVSENEETWIYLFIESTAKAQGLLFRMNITSNTKQKKLDVLLRDSVVVNFLYNNTPTSTTTSTTTIVTE